MFEALSSLLGESQYTHFVAVVAWARTSGLDRLVSKITGFRDRGGHAEIILGVDEGGASVEGLRAASALFDEAKVLYDATSGTFHPKLWIFYGDACAAVIVGSNNLTAGGLYANYEVSLLAELDLNVETDRAPYEEILEYVDRLRNDATMRPLTEELIAKLRESASISVKDEAIRRPKAGDEVDTDTSGAVAPDAARMFGRSNHEKKRDPMPRAGPAARGRTGEGFRGSDVGNTPRTGAQESPVVASWSKRLTRSDCGRPNPGSNTTNALRFTKAGHDIDQATWFREQLFADATWAPDDTRQGRERATVRFDVSINGTARGTHELEIKHDGRREAGQRNFTTDLKWGSLTPALREADLVGHIVYIDKHEDGALTMRIEEAPNLTERAG